MNRKRIPSEKKVLRTFFSALLLTSLLFSSGIVPVYGIPDQAGGAAGAASESSRITQGAGTMSIAPDAGGSIAEAGNMAIAPDAGSIPGIIGAAASAAESSGSAENSKSVSAADLKGSAEKFREDGSVMGISGTAGPGKTAAAQETFLFHEPSFREAAPNGKPMFELTWDAYPEADSYEIAFYAEGEDSYGRGPFAIRSTKNTYEGRTETPVVFLQGVYTDTVTYRMKVRPRIGVDAWTEPEDYVWSNIWEIRFVEGEYTVSETDMDFDLEIAAAEAKQKANATPTPTPAPAPERKDPLPHELPESFLTFLARENGEETPYDAGSVAKLQVSVFQGEAGSSMQNIGNADMIREFCEAVQNITVTDRKPSPQEEIFTTDSDFGTGFFALNEENEALFSFYLDGSTYERGDYIYTLEGTDALNDIDGLLTSDNMYDSWDAYEWDMRDYEDTLRDPAGISLLDASYAMHLMGLEEDGAVFRIGAYMDWNKDAGRLNTSDADEIRAVLKALSEATIGDPVSSPEGEMWHMTFSWWPSGRVYGGEAWLGLNGDCVKIGDHYFRVEGIEKLYEAVDCPFFNYMLNYSTAPTLKPSY